MTNFSAIACMGDEPEARQRLAIRLTAAAAANVTINWTGPPGKWRLPRYWQICCPRHEVKRPPPSVRQVLRGPWTRASTRLDQLAGPVLLAATTKSSSASGPRDKRCRVDRGAQRGGELGPARISTPPNRSPFSQSKQRPSGAVRRC